MPDPTPYQLVWREIALTLRRLANLAEQVGDPSITHTPTLGMLAEQAGIPVQTDPPAAVASAGETAAPAPPPSRRAPAGKKAPDSAPAAPAPAASDLPGMGAPAPAAAPPVEAKPVPPAATVQAVIAAMQAHAARFKAHGGAVATLKKVKTIDPAFSSASSVPEARRAEVIEKLNADQPGA
jgi:hypothetical protein